MVRPSNCIVGSINILTLFLSLILGAAGCGLYFHFHGGGTHCQQSLSYLFLVTGGSVLLVSVLGLWGTWGKNNVVLGIYLTLMFILLLIKIGFTGYLVGDPATRELVWGEGYKGNYSDRWLESYPFVNGEKWDRIRVCLVDVGVCKAKSINESPLLEKLQSGCCQPPSDCNLQSKNATLSKIPASGNDVDCEKWSKDQEKLCYYCNSCKAGFLQNYSNRDQWKAFLYFNISLIVILILLCLFGCCAFRSNREYAYNNQKGFP